MKQIPDGDESHTLFITFKDQYGDFMVPQQITVEAWNITEDSSQVGADSIIPQAELEWPLAGLYVTMKDSTNNQKEVISLNFDIIDPDNYEYTRCFRYELIPAIDCTDDLPIGYE